MTTVEEQTEVFIKELAKHVILRDEVFGLVERKKLGEKISELPIAKDEVRSMINITDIVDEIRKTATPAQNREVDDILRTFGMYFKETKFLLKNEEGATQ